jgi:hypothetical protein
MTIAWFRPATSADTATHLDAVVEALGKTHRIERIAEANAHDFVWQHARGRFDLCVYELDNTPRHVYMWPYLLHYPGVLALLSSTVHDSRRARLVHEGRRADYDAEIAFAGGPRHTRPPWHMARGQWPMLRIPVSASRLTVVADEQLGEDVAAAAPGAVVRLVRAGVAGPPPLSVQGQAGGRLATTIAIVEPSRREVVERAAARLRAEGLSLDLMDLATPDYEPPTTNYQPPTTNHQLPTSSPAIAVALRWPQRGAPLTSALSAMAAGHAVVVADTHATALWPTLDPQSWQPRQAARPAPAPIGVSIDPRDEEHSLVIALRRLVTDTPFREALGQSASAWWQANATIGHAVESWESVMQEALTLGTPPRPPGWPAHLDADGSAGARRILNECGVEQDPLGAAAS